VTPAPRHRTIDTAYYIVPDLQHLLILCTVLDILQGVSIKTLWLDGPCRTTRPRNERSGVRHSQAYKSHALTHDEGPADRHCFHGREAFVASRTHPCFRLTALHVRVHMLTYGSAGPVLLHDKASLVPSIPCLLAAHRLGTHEIVARIKQLVLMTGTLRTWCSRMGGLLASVELSSTQKAKNVTVMKHAGLCSKCGTVGTRARDSRIIARKDWPRMGAGDMSPKPQGVIVRVHNPRHLVLWFSKSAKSNS